MQMVDEVLDTLTKGEHSRTVDIIGERKKMEAEEEAIRRQQQAYEDSIRQEWKFVESMGLPESGLGEEVSAEENELIDFDGLKSLEEDLGISIKFVEDLKPILVSR